MVRVEMGRVEEMVLALDSEALEKRMVERKTVGIKLSECPTCRSRKKSARGEIRTPWGDCSCGTGEGCDQHDPMWMKRSPCNDPWHGETR